MKRCCELLNYVQYDTALYTSGDNLNIICNIMNVQLDKFVLWLKLNKLSLNINKTHYMIFTSSSQHFPSIVIRNNPLVKVTESKFLRVIIDNRLNSNAHVDKLCIKVSSAAGAVNRVRFFIPKSMNKTLYFSLVHPYLLYGICVRGSSGAGNVNRIKTLQEKVLKYLLITKIVFFL